MRREIIQLHQATSNPQLLSNRSSPGAGDSAGQLINPPPNIIPKRYQLDGRPLIVCTEFDLEF